MNISLKNKIINGVIKEMKDFYPKVWKELNDTYKTSSRQKNNGGIMREANGQFTEKILQKIFDTINMYLGNNKIISKVGGTDYLKKTNVYKGKTYYFDDIQVDRHVFFNNKRIAFIENKTYLDSCYYDRALADFRKIAQALKQINIDPASVKYIVFSGQSAANEEKILNYSIDFAIDTQHLSNKDLEVYTFYYQHEKRSSSKPSYQYFFDLNEDEIKRFVSLICDLI